MLIFPFFSWVWSGILERNVVFSYCLNVNLQQAMSIWSATAAVIVLVVAVVEAVVLIVVVVVAVVFYCSSSISKTHIFKLKYYVEF